MILRRNIENDIFKMLLDIEVKKGFIEIGGQKNILYDLLSDIKIPAILIRRNSLDYGGLYLNDLY